MKSPNNGFLKTFDCLHFKNGDRTLTCKYRPVFLTCVPCKLLEHKVCSNIMAYLDEYQFLSDMQHAFRKRYSCETQLTTVRNDWVKVLVTGGQVQPFILNFKKAFDNFPSPLPSPLPAPARPPHPPPPPPTHTHTSWTTYANYLMILAERHADG